MLFSATNEIAFHVPNPEAAEVFYTTILGCTVVDRNPDFISLSNGALRVHLVRDPERTHLGAVPSFEVHDRAAALVELQAVGCTLVPIGPHAPGEHYVRDPNGIVFDVVERREII